jgi:hypothetical protein
MFGNPAVGYLLAAAHYCSNLLLGILWGFKSSSPRYLRNSVTVKPRESHSPLNADPKLESIGKTLGSSINNALNNILAVGGFIVVFSVLTRMLSYWGFIDLIAANMVKLFSVFNLLILWPMVLAWVYLK